MNFNTLSIEEMAFEIFETSPLVDITIETACYNVLIEKHDYSDLDIVEQYAQENALNITCEQDLSDMFDDMINEVCNKDIILAYASGLDLPMLHEHFNDWADGLVQDGEIHQEQADNYCYIGGFKHEK